MKHKRIFKHTREALSEVDYLDKLSDAEREYLRQFYIEYYQADFDWEHPIHPESLHKDCRARKRASEYPDPVEQATRAYKAQGGPRQWRYYIPSDYREGVEQSPETDLIEAIDYLDGK